MNDGDWMLTKVMATVINLSIFVNKIEFKELEKLCYLRAIGYENIIKQNKIFYKNRFCIKRVKIEVTVLFFLSQINGAYFVVAAVMRNLRPLPLYLSLSLSLWLCFSLALSLSLILSRSLSLPLLRVCYIAECNLVCEVSG